MTVTSQRSAMVDLVRGAVVAVLAVAQVVLAALGAGAAVGEVARQYATPLLATGPTFLIWTPIYLGFLAYAAYQVLPGQRGRAVHRATGWWLAASAALNPAWILTFGADSLLLAEVMLVALLVCLAVVFGRLSRIPADGAVERVVLRATVAVYTGWVSLATVLGTAATGVWLGLPGEGALAVVAAVVGLLVTAVIVSWVVLAGTAVVGYVAAVVWGLVGIALNDPPPAVVVTCAVVIVVVGAATARRLTTAGNPPRAAWG